ncbi:hypothetical protein OAK65_02695 [Synechococcus sp. AH-551-N17]|nr:hypothetical protein [Synechococcus sp. AH-551-N17]
MPRKLFNNRKQECLSVSARNDADAITVLKFRRWCREQGVSVQRGLLMVVEGWLDCVKHGGHQ